MYNLKEQLKKYDKFLDAKKYLDGTVEIYRQSPFSKFQFIVFRIQNQYCGSNKWILKKVSLMDNQKRDIVGDVYKINWNLRNKKDNYNLHNEIASFLLEDQIII